jgi:hypothetical protein
MNIENLYNWLSKQFQIPNFHLLRFITKESFDYLNKNQKDFNSKNKLLSLCQS